MDTIDITPHDMLSPDAATQLPVQGDYVPLSIFGEDFSKEMPTVAACGSAAVRLSLGRPFGFMYGELASPTQTQLTPDLVFTKPNTGSRWTLTVQTEQPLTSVDEYTFGLGAYKYASFVQTRLRFPFKI